MSSWVYGSGMQRRTHTHNPALTTHDNHRSISEIHQQICRVRHAAPLPALQARLAPGTSPVNGRVGIFTILVRPPLTTGAPDNGEFQLYGTYAKSSNGQAGRRTAPIETLAQGKRIRCAPRDRDCRDTRSWRSRKISSLASSRESTSGRGARPRPIIAITSATNAHASRGLDPSGRLACASTSERPQNNEKYILSTARPVSQTGRRPRGRAAAPHRGGRVSVDAARRGEYSPGDRRGR